MLRLDIQKEPYWMDLPANVRLFLRPISTPIMSAAKDEVFEEMRAIRQEITRRAENGEQRRELPDLDDPKVSHSVFESLLIKALARGAVIEWEGVMTPDGKEPAPPERSAINDLMTIWHIGLAFWEKYMGPISLLEIEGNASRPGANGTSPAGLDTAEGATTKTSPARKAKPIR